MSSSSGQAPISRRREVTKEIATGFGLVTPNVIRDVLKALKLPPIGTKNTMIQAIEDTVMKHGIQLFLSKFKKQTLKQIAYMLECEPKIRVILDIIMTHGLPAFLQQKCDVKLLQECCRMLGLDPGSALDSSSTVAKSSEDLEREVADEVMLMGTDEMLRSMPLNVLTELARDLNILPPITDINATPTFPNGNEVNVLALTESIMDKIFDLVSVQHYMEIALPPRTHQNSADSGSQSTGAVSGPPPAKRAKLLSYNEGSNDAPDTMEDANGAASSSAAAFISSQNAVRRSKTTKGPRTPKAAKNKVQAASPTKLAPDAEENATINHVAPVSHGAKKPKGSKTATAIQPTEDKMEVDDAVDIVSVESTAATAQKTSAVKQEPVLNSLERIKPGVMISELHKFFSVADLHRYCHQEGLQSAGLKKQQLAKKIMAHLETKVAKPAAETTNTEPGTKST